MAAQVCFVFSDEFWLPFQTPRIGFQLVDPSSVFMVWSILPGVFVLYLQTCLRGKLASISSMVHVAGWGEGAVVVSSVA